MLRLVEAPNTKTGRTVRVIGKADEAITYQEMQKRLGLINRKRSAAVHERSEEAIAETTLSREQVKVSSSSPLAGFVSELAKYADFETVQVKGSEPSYRKYSSIGEAIKNSTIEEWESLKFEQLSLFPEEPAQATSPEEPLYEDLLRLHPGSENYVCICTVKNGEGKRGKWHEHWTRSSLLLEKYEELRQGTQGFDGYDVYVSQLEFKSASRPEENVAGFKVCFVDIDGKLAWR